MTTSAERTRRYRKRRRDGDVVIKLTLDAGGVADLIDLGWLQPGASKKAVPQALVGMLEMAFDSRVSPERDLSPLSRPRHGDEF